MHHSRIIQKAVAVLMQACEGKKWAISECSRGGLLAWLLWQGGVVGDVVVLGGISVGLVVYRREVGEETVNTMQT